MKKVFFTTHSRERMHERNISESDVHRALNNPNIRLPSGSKKKKKIMAEIPDKSYLTVVYTETRSKYTVVSVFWKGE